MKRLWVVLVLCAGCNSKHKAEEKREPAAAPTAEPSETGRDITSPLPLKGPHPHYPTAAAAGTDKIFFLEEPDRGPKAPASYSPPPRASLTWTTHPYCEVDPLGVACSTGKVTASNSWRVGRAKGVVIVEKLRGDTVDETTAFVSGPDGARAQRLHLDAASMIDEASLFTAPGRFSGRRRGGGNALPGCGLFAYDEDKQHHIHELRCLQWLGDPMRDTSGVAVRRFTYDAHGFVADEQRFGLDGAPINDTSGVQRVVYTRDADGRVTLEQHFDADAQRVTATSGCAGYRRVWSTNATLVTRTCLDLADQPTRSGDGITTEHFDYVAIGCRSKTRYTDAAGNPAVDHGGIAGFDYTLDARCQVTSRVCLNAAEKRTSCGIGDPPETDYTYDERGFPTSIRYVNADGSPGNSAEYHVHELRYTYDAAGNTIELGCFDAFGASVLCSSTGFHAWRATYDDVGRKQTESFLDVKGQPGTNLGVAQRRYRYDNYDHQYEARETDTDGKTIEGHGMAIRHNLYDAAHRLFAVQLLDAQLEAAHYTACYTGATCPRKPWHAMRINRHPSGHVESNEFFDADGQLLETIDCAASPCFDRD